jgi:hypothetical protein
MTNVSFLDANGDGFWSHDDDLAGLSKAINHQYGKDGDLMRMFENFMKDARDIKFTVQTSENFDAEASKAATFDYTKIPISWMEAEKERITLCNNVDPTLCGNLEARNILRGLLPEEDQSNYRVRKCRSNYDWCEDKFGELYRNYRDMVEGACDSKTAIWDAADMVTIFRYDRADNYESNICSPTYETFLLLVLLIWWLTILNEFREVTAAVGALLLYDTGLTEIEESEDKITVMSISRTAKVTILIFVMLPRLILVICLATIGTDFLIVTDNYSDLILNSVALGFLIEVDEYLFTGVASERDKEQIEKFTDMEAECPCAPCWVECSVAHTTMTYAFGVVGVSIALTANAYFMEYGKADLSQAFGCLCHAEGDNCLVAQLFGHNTTIWSALALEGKGSTGRLGKGR